MKLSTGRELPDDLSLDSSRTSQRLRSGYDSFEEYYDDEPPAPGEHPSELTAVERVEVADEMCAQWRAWAGLGGTDLVTVDPVLVTAVREMREKDGGSLTRACGGDDEPSKYALACERLALAVLKNAASPGK